MNEEGPERWEEEEPVRRDLEPHRADFLLWLAQIAYYSGCFGMFFVPVLLGVPLGLVVVTLARLDLIKMDAGRMDRDGMNAIRDAWRLARTGCLTSSVWLGIWCIPLGLFLVSAVLSL